MEAVNLRERYEKLGGSARPVQRTRSIRVNNIKINPKQLLKRFKNIGVKLEQIPFSKDGYYVVKSKFSLGAIPEYLLGFYSLQEAAAQIPVQLLRPNSKDTVLDMAAAPGGKTIQMADMMHNSGQIVALDLKQKRLIALKNHLERCGVRNTVVYNFNAVKFAEMGFKFDKILLDAPCSGNYTMEEGWFRKRDLSGIQRNAELQRNMLEAGFRMLKKDGVLVYSTCSLEPEEDELNVDYCLKNFDVKLERINTIGQPGLTYIFGKKLDPSIKLCRRLWPHKTKTQGFFVAKFRKR